MKRWIPVVVAALLALANAHDGLTEQRAPSGCVGNGSLCPPIHDTWCGGVADPTCGRVPDDLLP